MSMSPAHSRHRPVPVILLSLLLSLLLLIPSVSSVTFTPSFTNSEVRRVVDLTTHVEEVAVVVKAVNSGSASASSYLVCVPSSKIGHLSFVEAMTDKGSSSAANFQRLYKEDEKKHRLVTQQVDVSGVDLSASSLDAANLTFFAVTLPAPVAPGASVSFTLFLTFTRTLTPLPSHKQQDEPQLVLYHDSSLFLSPYPTTNQRSTFKLQSPHIESYTRKHASVSSDSVEYGPFMDSVAAFSHSPISMHYQNNAAFVTMISMRKEVEVSQWGNVAVTEWYEMRHTGAVLTGPFSRFDYQARGNEAKGSFNLLRASLPSVAHGIYYRDYIGNVSTSHVRKGKGETVMEVNPRFPMFGGWSAEFEIGYNVPAATSLSVIDQYAANDRRRQGNYLLTASFGSMFPAAAIDQAEVRVIFPEGSSAIQWATPFDIDSADDSGLHFTHLDTTGRPVLTLRKSNVVRFHNQPISVSYAFSPLLMMREPLLVISAVMAFFLLSMAYYRVELGLGHDDVALIVKKDL